MCFEAQLDGVESSELDAVISSEAHDVNIGHLFFLQEFAEASRVLVIVIVESTVAINVRIHALFEDLINAVHHQPGSDFRAAGFLNAMYRPELLQALFE